MAEHLNNEELALELTKIYSKNHSDVSTANQGRIYPLSRENIGAAYQFFLKVVEHDLKFDFSKKKED